MKNTRFTAKSLENALPALNETLEKMGDPLRFVYGSRYNYSAIDLATPEQLAAYCCQRTLETGTPRECLAACHSYVSQSAARFAQNSAPAAPVAA